MPEKPKVAQHTHAARIGACIPGAQLLDAVIPPKVTPVQQYFFDISGVAAYLRRISGFTGIQRAVVMLIEYAARDLDPGQVCVAFYSPAHKAYLAVRYTDLAPGTLMDAGLLRSTLGFDRAAGGMLGRALDRAFDGLCGAAAHPALRGYRDKPAKLWFHSRLMRLNALIGNEAHFRRRNTTREDWTRARRVRAAPVAGVPFETQARPGDHLILLDSTFRLPRATAAILAASRQGLTVHSMVHDLIPVVTPQFCRGTLPLNFHDWLLQTGTYTSGYLANSQATGRDLVRFLDTYGIALPVRVVPLAQAGLPPAPGAAQGTPLLDPVHPTAYAALHAGAGIDDQIRALMRHPYVLCVGTLEVRKNIWKIAQAWDRLRRVPGLNLPKLVFAGRRGWLVEDFEAFMTATGNLNGWVEIIDGPSDADLEYLYRNCLFTVMASFYEGWGLPIGESLACGKTAVVSNTSSMPEVGADLVEYCDPQSIESIAQACLTLIGNPGHRLALEARIAATRLRGWQDVARDLVAAVRAQQNMPQPAAPGAGPPPPAAIPPAAIPPGEPHYADGVSGAGVPAGTGPAGSGPSGSGPSGPALSPRGLPDAAPAPRSGPVGDDAIA